MQQQVSLARKMFSHSNKTIWTSAAAIPTPTKSLGIRGKIQISLQQKFKGSLAKLHYQQKYERFIDNLLMHHAQEEKIPVLTKNFTRKHQYKSYRIVKTEQIQTNPEQHIQKGRLGRELIETRRSQSERKITEGNEQEKQKQKKTLELPLIFKFKKNGQAAGDDKQRTEQSQGESTRQSRLKELKQQMILKYIRTPL